MPRDGSGNRPPAHLLTAVYHQLWHGLRVEVAPRDQAPFPIDALVVEDDTWQVLGADPEFRPTAEHPIRLMQALRTAEPIEPGTVVVVDAVPIRLHAVVHDLDREPTLREEWIAAALEKIFHVAADRSFEALGVPVLGTRFGRLPEESFVAALDQALAGRKARSPRRLWVIRP